MRRRILITFAALIGVIAVVIATLPFWLGAALTSLAPRWGVTFGDYTRVGYDRFALTDLKAKQGGIRATVERVELDSPIPWLWHRFIGNGGAVVVKKWRVDLERAANAPAATSTADGPVGWMPLPKQPRDIVAQVDPWIARTTIGPGVVHWSEAELALDGINWRERTLQLERLAFKDRIINVTLAIPAEGDEIRFTAATANEEGSLALVSRGAA